jgi:hypothetical protein
VSKGIQVGLQLPNPLRVVSIILLVLAGLAFHVQVQTETNLCVFGSQPNDGDCPAGGLVQGSGGNFYGTIEMGGPAYLGAVFELTVSLSPVSLSPPPYPINQITSARKSATNIIFTIPSIAGETYQLQFSSMMNPAVWSNVPVSVTNSIGSALTITNLGGHLRKGSIGLPLRLEKTFQFAVGGMKLGVRIRW